jgi:hypothetical protein
MHSAVTVNGPDPQPIVGLFTFDGKLKLFAVFSAASYNRPKAQEFLDRTTETLTRACQVGVY